MINVVYNEALGAIQLDMDRKGVDLLKCKLAELQGEMSHVHLYETNNDEGLSRVSPYRFDVIYPELVLNLIPADAWKDEPGSSLHKV